MAAILLFGGIGELIPVIITVIVIVLSLLNQVFRAQEKRPPAPKQPDRQRPPPQRKAPGDLSGEIEEFLQRAQQQQRRPAEAGRAGQPAPAVVVDRPPQKRAQRDRKPAKPAKPQRAPAESAPVTAEVVRAEIAGRPTAVSDGSAFDDDGSRSLRSGELKPAEASFAGPSETQGRDDPGALGHTSLVHLLTNAESIREAIILNEILRRPEERWS